MVNAMPILPAARPILLLLFLLCWSGGALAASDNMLLKASISGALEQLFPMAVHYDSESASTQDSEALLNGSKQSTIFLKGARVPLRLHSGDRLTYTLNKVPPPGSLFLTLSSETGPKPLMYLPLNAGENGRGFLKVPGFSGAAMLAHIENPEGLKDIVITITNHPLNPDWGRALFRSVLKRLPKDSATRKRYLRTSGNRLRLRSVPNSRGKRIVYMRRHAYVKVLESRDGWTRIELPNAVKGWVSSKFIEEIP